MLLIWNLNNHERARMDEITKRIFPDSYSQRSFKSKTMLLHLPNLTLSVVWVIRKCLNRIKRKCSATFSGIPQHYHARTLHRYRRLVLRFQAPLEVMSSTHDRGEKIVFRDKTLIARAFEVCPRAGLQVSREALISHLPQFFVNALCKSACCLLQSQMENFFSSVSEIWLHL